MSQGRLKVDRIWWRNVPLGEFYNVERHHIIPGGGGSLYFEIPSSIVSETLEFLDTTYESLPVTIQVNAVGSLEEGSFPLQFASKAGGRMRIVRQNRRQPNSQRHPAWTAARGFPIAPDDIESREDALPYFPEGGLRIYIVKTVEGNYYAGFTKGTRPEGMKPNHPMSGLFQQGDVVGGVIDAN